MSVPVKNTRQIVLDRLMRRARNIQARSLELWREANSTGDLNAAGHLWAASRAANETWELLAEARKAPRPKLERDKTATMI